MKELTCQKFLELLASSSPVPGGGGACALVGAAGVALASMVANLTVGKKKYESVQEEVKAIVERANSLRALFLDLVEEDARGFEPLSKAYSLPRDTEEEKRVRERILEEALIGACSAPLKIMRACLDSLSLHEELAEKGTKIAISDVGTGAVLLKAALLGASLNVFSNTRLMKNAEKARTLNSQAEEILEKGLKQADQVIQRVANYLKSPSRS
ncbi:MAG: cyclodeaminase/cyclohydrolase family protein [Caldiserica bacterium]|jgi:formiminotetrahydrofolate cyclodeaminase|nr:cyclodeaminase/cyclohydrolase family protein [Caldisericota bacterium]MDH7563101.1 cyclodeaminase/cyclohydrolase family protein [Caldisericota bacterium]